jgi:hypothetical protein
MNEALLLQVALVETALVAAALLVLFAHAAKGSPDSSSA